MSSISKSMLVLLAFTVLACDQDRDPSITAPKPVNLLGTLRSDLDGTSVAAEAPVGDVKQSVTGSYQAGGDNTGNNFKYAVTAIRHEDGSVSGEFEERVLDPAGELIRHTHGVVTCVEIVGNIARIGGVLDHAVNPLPDPIPQFHLIVADNGNGASGVRDLASNARFGGTAQQFCDAGVPFNLEEIDHGNIEIHP
jgi:hypothetical protein